MMISIVILTYNRPDCLKKQLRLLCGLRLDEQDLEIIIVDNASEPKVDNSFVGSDPRIKIVRNRINLGAVGRNYGMRVAKGDIIITLDDDVYGLTDYHIEALQLLFKPPDVAAVNFKVVEEGTGRIANWCHPYDEKRYHNEEFETSEISEGAVAFRRSTLCSVGYYPDYFFISHEGADLAFRLINKSWRILYTPQIIVTHAYEDNGRTNWRRYYYDTRNQLWLVLRNYPFLYGLKKLFIGWSSMLVYSVRDGYFKYWMKAVWDAINEWQIAWGDRSTPKKEAIQYIMMLEENKPGFWHMVRKRLLNREVKI
jgi:GT2 family glycosyltransferase